MPMFGTGVLKKKKPGLEKIQPEMIDLLGSSAPKEPRISDSSYRI